MAMFWPEVVPFRAVAGSFQGDPFQEPLASEFEDGNRRMRRRSTLNIATIGFTIQMSNEQFAAFKAWVRDELVDGTLPFTMTVWTGTAYEPRVCQFRERYTFDPRSGLGDTQVHLSIDVEDY